MPQLAPPPKFRAVGADGLALVGGKLYTYTEGTSTPKATYTDFGLGTANTNPVILDARGEADVWLDGSYKLVLKDADDVTIWTVDSIRDLTQNQTFTGATLAGTLTVSSTAVTWSGNPTHSGNHTFTSNVTVNGNATLNGNNVLGNASTDTLTVAPNAVTWSNDPTHSGNHTWSGTQTYSAAVTFSTTSTFTGAPTFNANPLGRVLGSTYTPTVTSVANLTASSANGTGKYGRLGNVVFGMVSVAVDETSTSTTTTMRVSLPVASNFTTGTDLLGGGFNSDDANILVSGDTTNDEMSLTWTSPGSLTPSHSATIWFCYEVK